MESIVVRRLRGAVLRLVRRRLVASTLGFLLVLPAAWGQYRGRFDVWWLEGFSLVAGATGVALLWAGLLGLKPDWTDNDRGES